MCWDLLLINGFNDMTARTAHTPMQSLIFSQVK